MAGRSPGGSNDLSIDELPQPSYLQPGDVFFGILSWDKPSLVVVGIFFKKSTGPASRSYTSYCLEVCLHVLPVKPRAEPMWNKIGNRKQKLISMMSLNDNMLPICCLYDISIYRKTLGSQMLFFSICRSRLTARQGPTGPAPNWLHRPRWGQFIWMKWDYEDKSILRSCRWIC